MANQTFAPSGVTMTKDEVRGLTNEQVKERVLNQIDGVLDSRLARWISGSQKQMLRAQSRMWQEDDGTMATKLKKYLEDEPYNQADEDAFIAAMAEK